MKTRIIAIFGLFLLSISFVFIVGHISLANASYIKNDKVAELNEVFQNIEAAFVVTDLNKNEYTRYNPERCQQRFSPHSTFKIPNSLIALETGIIKDENVVVAYDRTQHPPEAWWPVEWQRPQNMRRAIKYSVVWFYQEIAKKVGKPQYQKYLKQFQYGNQDVSGNIEHFWLGSSLQISPNEQVEFLKKFYNGKLGVSNRTTNIVKDILVLEQNNDYKLSGKTGCASPANNCNTLSWLVGYLEKADNIYFFATNIEGNGQEISTKKRIALTKQALTKLGILTNQY